MPLGVAPRRRRRGALRACGARLEKLTRLKVAEKERESLAGAKAEAEAYVVAEDSIRRRRNLLYQVMRREAQANVDLVTGRHAELSARLEEEAGKRAEIEKGLSGDVAAVAALGKAHAGAAAALEAAAKAATDAETRDAELREAGRCTKKALQKLTATVVKETAVIAEKEAFVAEQTGEKLPRLEKKVATMGAKAAEAEAALEVARAACEKETAAAQKVLDAKNGSRDITRNKTRAKANLAGVNTVKDLELSDVRGGIYKATAPGYNGDMDVEVMVKNGKLVELKVTRYQEKQFYSSLTDTRGQILAKQSVDIGVDATTMATQTAEAIQNAAIGAVAKGKRKRK